MSANTNGNNAIRNVTTTNEQPPNKFASNTKKVQDRPVAIKNRTDKILHSKQINTKLDLAESCEDKSLVKQDTNPQIMASTISSQQVEDFAKKKQERDEEIMEIQEMLNKMKSPQKSTERSSQALPLMNNGEESQEPATSSNIVAEKKVNETVENDTPFFGRCKTELQLLSKPLDSANSRMSRRDTARSSSTAAVTSKPRSQSSQLPLSAKQNKTIKKLNYNPEEARRYMEMQRKHRKENILKDPIIKSKIEKEEIKKRLEELKKNTRKLVYKSVQKKEKFLNKNFTNREADVTKSTEQKHAVKEAIKEQEHSNRKVESDKQDLKCNSSLRSEHFKEKARSKVFNKETKNASIDLPVRTVNTNQAISHRSTQSLNNVLRPSAKSCPENNKRIGLLRKTENIKDFSLASHRNYNFNKENQNLERLTKQLMNPVDNKTNQFTNKLQNKKEPQIDIAKKDDDSQDFIEEKLNENNLKSNRNIEKEEHKPNELPYWLRPSATQVYPYNFIAAVRKKLESIAHPFEMRVTAGKKKQNQQTSTTGLNDESMAKKKKFVDSLEEKQNKKIKNQQETTIDFKKLQEKKKLKQIKPLPQSVQIKETEYKEDDESRENSNNEPESVLEEKPKHFPNIENIKKSAQSENCQNNTNTQRRVDDEESQKLSRHLQLPTHCKSLESLNSVTNSNISSISLQMPISNTLTEVSSLRTESRRTYTHFKNQPFTQSEDELASFSSQLFSSPEKNLYRTQKDFEFIKPRPVSPLSLEKVDKLKIKRRETLPQQDRNENEEMDFTQLLDDFNRSLSQVIQVNEQLKSSLDKSQQILSPLDKKSTESEKYSSDFEQTPTALIAAEENYKLKQSLQKSNEKLQVRKKQLFEIVEKVKPFFKPQTPVTEQAETKIKTITIPNMNLSITSLTNTNATTSGDEHKSSRRNIEDEEEDSSSIEAQSYEKRLNQIEKLKETLKQTILESKEKRKVRQHESKIKISTQNENNCETETGSKSKVSEKYGKQEAQLKKNSSDLKIVKNQIFEKYQKQYKNINHTKALSESENATQTDSLKLENKQSKEIKESNYANEKNQEFKESSNNNQRPLKQILTDFKSKTNLPETPVNDGEIVSTSHTQTEADSTSHTKEIITSNSLTKTQTSQTAAVSSSIAEEIQNTFVSVSYDNENKPLNAKSTTNLSTNLNEKIVSSNFIETHINRSRGDFQETISEKSQFNETQFQQAIEAASQISSTELAQSADDEITSSVASKHDPKSATNSRKLPYSLVSSPCSPTQMSERVSIGGEIVRFFKQYDSTRNERLTNNNDSMSESSLNYSNVGLYEKLIQNETNKSQQLMSLLKMREKALMDRTKGQIAWLEVQKARYKAKGLTNQIVAIKKKQRAILVKMEKEREEIKRLLYMTTSSKTVSATTVHSTGGQKLSSHHNSPIKHKRERLPAATPVIKPKHLGQHLTQSTSPKLRATYELESSRAVEDLLRKREEDLKKRREHVERLMVWHQRLDEEEAEVLNLERQLLSYNNAPYLPEQQQPQQPKKLSTATTNSASKEKLTPAGKALSASLCEQANNVFSTKKKCASRARKMEKRLKEIDKSLRELSHISASSTTSGVMGQTLNEKEDANSSAANQEIDFVRITGIKLNKLWKRLTSQQIEKFEPLRRYKLCKSDLERLYEEAKMAVLRDFAEDDERIAKELLEKSASNISYAASSPGNLVAAVTTACESKIVDVPMLNLNFSSGHSEAEEESANNSQHNTKQQGNYSPSVAEENFKAQVLLNSSASSETVSEQQMPVEDQQHTSRRLENNVQMFLALSQRIQASSGHHLPSSSGKQNQTAPGDRKLQRSLSDTEIADVSTKYKAVKTTTSQKTLQTVASHSNSSIATGSFDASAQHQRSKSSIVEMTTYIPSTQTATLPINTDLAHLTGNPSHQQNKQIESRKELATVNHLYQSQTNSSRNSVICSVGSVPPLKTSQDTSSDIVSITENVKTTNSLIGSDQPRSSYSGQVGKNSETTAKEISSKLDEISVAVAQLSQMNKLPSYESVAHTHFRNKSIEDSNDETILSVDASSSSYSFNFENITTDKHSSPGSSTALNTPPSMQQTTLASKTYTTAEMDQEHNETTKISNSVQADTSNSTNSTISKTFIKDETKISSHTYTQSMLENHILDTYEADFESDLSNVTHIEDITIPAFEITAETTQDNEEENYDNNASYTTEKSSSSKCKENQVVESVSAKLADKTFNANELKNALSLSDSDKSLSQMDFMGVLSPPPPPPPLPPLSSSPTAASSTILNTVAGSHLMPDIINELELRRHQIILDNEHLKQYEHVTAVPYMFVREIPNKPPPPYVPPAHGSPMTTIFPSEERIKDITFRRTHELYCELLKTEYCNEIGEKLPSVMGEQITNIYERIILDICREYLDDHGEILQDGDPINFHSQLAFFNPPNRLRCIQDAIYKEVRTCLAMDKIQPKRTQTYSVYGQRAKQDYIGKIIIQEMYDEDDRWCNFHREESEVLHLMVEEMITKNMLAIAKEVLLDEGGTIDEENNQTMELEENVANHQADDKSHCEQSIQEEEGRKRQQHSQLETSSILVETASEDDVTYCVSETAPQFTVLNQNTSIETEPQQNVSVDNMNLTTSPNAVQTCT